MAFQTFTFDLELQPGGAPPVIYASAGDVGRPFTASLYWNGEAWTATGTTAKIRGKKPDKTVFDYTATVDGSSVTFATTEQMTIIPGPVECELVFTQDGDVIASANFVLIVEDSPYNPDALSESDVYTLTELVIDAIGDAITTLESGLTDLETRLSSGDEDDAGLHLDFYIDTDGDLCQVD